MSTTSEKFIECGGLLLDLRSRRATVNGADLYLGAGEFDLLATLAAEPGSVAKASELIGTAFRNGVGVSAETVWRAVARVQRKLELRGMPAVLERVSEDGIRLRPSEVSKDAEASGAVLAEAA